jgi:hypothetical protein
MRYNLVSMLILLVCCGGCVTRTTKDQSGNIVEKSRTVWIWEKDFWGKK